MKKPRKTPAPSGGGFTPVAFFLDARASAEDGTHFKNKRSPRGTCSGRYSLLWDGYGTGRESPAQRNLRHFSACFPEIHEPPDVASS